MILCLTPNSAVDRTALVPRLTFGDVLRPTAVLTLPGGKGNNVARAVVASGALAATTGFVGGHAGRWLVEALEAEGLNPRFVEVEGETRTTYVTVDASGRSTLVYEPGVPVTDADADGLIDLIRATLLPAATWSAICGSPPPGLRPERYRDFVDASHTADRPCAVDVGGEPLSCALLAGPDVVKVTRDEAASVLGGARDALAAAQALVSRGSGLAVVTDGPGGAAACDGRSAWRIEVPPIRAVDAVGSGDAFTAGLIVSLAAGRPVDEALAIAAATGTANAEVPGAGRFDPARQTELVDQIRVRRHRLAGAS